MKSYINLDHYDVKRTLFDFELSNPIKCYICSDEYTTNYPMCEKCEELIINNMFKFAELLRCSISISEPSYEKISNNYIYSVQHPKCIFCESDVNWANRHHNIYNDQLSVCVECQMNIITIDNTRNYLKKLQKISKLI